MENASGVEFLSPDAFVIEGSNWLFVFQTHQGMRSCVPGCRPSTKIGGLIHNLDGHVIAFSGSDLGVVL